MKTPEEILKLYPALTHMKFKLQDIEMCAVRIAMKEYAKQWVEEASKIGKEYPYGKAITDSILDIKQQIDAQ